MGAFNPLSPILGSGEADRTHRQSDLWPPKLSAIALGIAIANRVSIPHPDSDPDSCGQNRINLRFPLVPCLARNGKTPHHENLIPN